MTTYAAGQSATIDISANAQYTISTTDDAYVDIISGVNGAGTSDRLFGNRKSKVYGPWGVTARITVRSIAGTVTVDDRVDRPVTATANLTGRIESFNFETDIDAICRVTRSPDFWPSILGSLVSGATYGQSGNTVTVTATAHGLPTTKNGYRIFWPGSAAIPAGWYFGFQYVDANTYTFQNPVSQSVAAATAITGALPITSGDQVCIVDTLPGQSVGKFGQITLAFVRSGDTTSGNKTLRPQINNTTLASQVLTTAPYANSSVTAVCNGSLGSQMVVNAMDGVVTTTQNTLSFDLSEDVLTRYTLQVQNASQWIALDNAHVEIKR